MERSAKVFLMCLTVVLIVVVGVGPVEGQSPPLRTPLDQETLTLLANEVSGQMIFNNMVTLAGAPWVRDRSEFADTFHESKEIHNMVRQYGIETTRLDRYEGRGTIRYPMEAEFWLTAPQKRLIARLGADAALVAAGSVTADVTGELVYIPPMNAEQINRMIAAGPQETYDGKIALLWSHAGGNVARALDAAGIRAVISFNSRERYLDPDQIVYSSGSYGGHENLKLGFTVSWRQWSEMLEDLEAGRTLTARCMAKIEQFPSKSESVFSWIGGSEPDEKGVIFTAHLFEGYTKRGANDNMSGCVVQLEILRALSKLIRTGELAQPRRTIYFLWPNEISGTNEFLRSHPDIIPKLSVNINMDMAGGGLRLSNAQVEYCEAPDHLPSYIDGLMKSILNYVWRTNDIVYLPDSPRGRPGGQYFPVPMMEKNGSRDAFRFLVHRATGGSDHTCFWNPEVGVPGIYIGVWPDQWYHADTDTPDKTDPTQLKRMAFIGAAAAWATAQCTDQVLAGLLDATTEFGLARVAERELPEALSLLRSAGPDNLDSQTQKALNRVSFGINRETEAVKSTEEIYSGSPRAREMVEGHVEQWRLYGRSLNEMILNYATLLR